VSTNKDGYKTVNYAQLTLVLIETLKEQQAQLAPLKAEAARAKAALQTVQAQATATLDTFDARLRHLESVAGRQARKQALEGTFRDAGSSGRLLLLRVGHRRQGPHHAERQCAVVVHTVGVGPVLGRLPPRQKG
jgi:FtsZ-binding cell division protein ZapB